MPCSPSYGVYISQPIRLTKPSYHLTSGDVRSKAVILLLLIYCSIFLPLFVGILFLSAFCNALLCVRSSVAIILNRKLKLVVLLLFS